MEVYKNLFERISSAENLFSAWDDFKRDKRNKFDVLKFEWRLEENIFQLYRELKTKTYKHSNYKSFFVQDPKLRHIHKACVRDRILHHAVFRILYHIFDKTFIFDSYSCRNEKGTHRAVNRLQKFARKANQNNTKNCFVLKCDVRKFFDSMGHNILISLIKNRIKDEGALWLIEEIVKSFSTSGGKGLPLGNITSQLFANIYLNKLDRFIKHKLKIKYYIRYCDDFVIISDNREYLGKLIFMINNFLNIKLELSLHSGKIEIRKYRQGIDFLGYINFPYCRILRTKTQRRMFRKLEQKIRQLKQGKILKEFFNQNVQSYLGTLKHCNSYKLKIELYNKI